MQTEKQCTNCGIVYLLDEFYRRKNGRCSECKQCTKIRNKQNHRRYYLAHKVAVLDKNKRYLVTYMDKYKPVKNQRKRHRYATDIEFKLAASLRRRMTSAIKRSQKTGSAVADLGCSISEFKNYIAGKFQFGMSWDNYGEWHLDHIKPLSSFNLSNREEFLQAAHYTNYQPLWAVDNLKKGCAL